VVRKVRKECLAPKDQPALRVPPDSPGIPALLEALAHQVLLDLPVELALLGLTVLTELTDRMGKMVRGALRVR
jgi:hypothetical protein